MIQPGEPMNRFLKAIAVLIILVHIVAGLVFAGIIPLSLVQSFWTYDIQNTVDLIRGISGQAHTDQVNEENSLQTSDTGEKQDEEPVKTEPDVKQEELDRIHITLSEPLPSVTEEDLYDLTGFLRSAGAIRAADGHGRDQSDQIRCDISADISDPGHFTAAFSIEDEGGQVERGPSADLRVELDRPFLALKETDISIPVGSDYNPVSNIVICMDLDGTVLTDFVALEGELNTAEAGTCQINYLIYSRVNGSFTMRTVQIHVGDL